MVWRYVLRRSAGELLLDEEAAVVAAVLGLRGVAHHPEAEEVRAGIEREAHDRRGGEGERAPGRGRPPASEAKLSPRAAQARPRTGRRERRSRTKPSTRPVIPGSAPSETALVIAP